MKNTEYKQETNNLPQIFLAQKFFACALPFSV